MIKKRIDDFKGGWFIGSFEPTLLKTDVFEVAYKMHRKDELWPKHYHAIATEYNCLVLGSMTVNGETINQGDVFVIYPGEISEPKFLEDCHIMVVKTPSLIGDKYETQEKKV